MGVRDGFRYEFRAFIQFTTVRRVIATGSINSDASMASTEKNIIETPNTRRSKPPACITTRV